MCKCIHLWHKHLHTEYKECFDLFDANGDGMISIDELEGMMCKFGDKPDPEELKKMMDTVDTDGK